MTDVFILFISFGSSLPTQNTGDKIVAVFITRAKGEELAGLADNGTRVMMQITVGSHYTYRFTNINR